MSAELFFVVAFNDMKEKIVRTTKTSADIWCLVFGFQSPVDPMKSTSSLDVHMYQDNIFLISKLGF